MKYKKYDLGSTLGSYKEPSINLSGNLRTKISANNYTAKNYNYTDYGNKLNDVVPFISNVANSFRRLPNPPKPIMENYFNPALINLDNARNDVRRSQLNTNSGLNYRLGNSAVAQALRGQNLATTVNSMNDISAQEANSNSNIINNNNYLNSYVGYRNTERKNQYNQDIISKTVNQQRIDSGILANASDKYQFMRKDKNLMNLENRKLDILPEFYKDTGVYNRNLLDEAEKEKYGNLKYGGNVNFNPKNPKHFSRWIKGNKLSLMKRN